MIITIIVFILVLSVLVFVHEFGHFIAAKIFKVGVEEFGMGMPPKIIGWKKGETIYSLNWIPIGGFTKIKGIVGGDQDNNADNKATDGFMNKPIWQRFIILFGGVFMNFILCVGLFAAGYIVGFPSITEDLPASAIIKNQEVVILEIIPNMPAEKADLQTGDVIKKINNESINSIDNIKEIIAGQQENSIIKLEIKREAEIISKDLEIVKIDNSQQSGIGVYLTETGLVSYPWYEAIYRGFLQTLNIIVLIIKALWNIIFSLFSTGRSTAEFTGPIGIAVLTGQMTKLGYIYVLQFTALLSINLAIFNLLPLPALDGGRLIFLIIEKLRGKPTNQKVEAIVHNIGFALLIILILLVTFQDFSKYEIVNHIKNLFT